jgi:HlyD family secretion protein
MTRVKNHYVIVSSPSPASCGASTWKPGAVVEAGRTVLAVLETKGADLLDARGEAQARAQVQAAAARREFAAAQRDERAGRVRVGRTGARPCQRTARTAGSVSQQELDAAETRAITTRQDARAPSLRCRSRSSSSRRRAPCCSAASPRARRRAASRSSSPRRSAAACCGCFRKANAWCSPAIRCSRWAIPPTSRRASRCSRATAWPSSPGRACSSSNGAVPRTARRARAPRRARGLHQDLRPGRRGAARVCHRGPHRSARAAPHPRGRVSRRGAHRNVGKRRRAQAARRRTLPARRSAWQTYVLDGGTARLRTVQTGHSSGLETEILGGLAAGERVLMYPGDKIADGVRVRPITVTDH